MAVKRHREQFVYPIRKLRDVRSIKKLLTDKPRDFCLFVVGISVGIRAIDLLKITVGDARTVDTGSKMHLKEQKTKKYITITVNQDAADAMRKYADFLGDKFDDDEPLFQGQRGPITRHRVTALVKEWTSAINLPGNYGSHSLRKTFGVHSYERLGTPLPVIQCQ